jgi:peptidoglycan-associated lipoprotein
VFDSTNDPLELGGHLVISGWIRSWSHRRKWPASSYEDGGLPSLFMHLITRLAARRREHGQLRHVLVCESPGDVMTRSRACFLLLGCLAVGACSKAAKKPTTPPPAQTASREVAAPTPAKTETVAASPNVGVSDDLAKRCRLQFASLDQAPKFDFNQFELLAEDRNVLEQVAQCLTRGPLQGKAVQLVGRADPRGTDEYNLGLGTRRAESVSSYLRRLGVPAQQLQPSTRGALDATGADEVGWRADRRVDLQLKE